MSVPLFESAGAAGVAGEPQPTTMVTTTGPTQPTQPSGFDFDPGGRGTDPVIRVGSTSLGYEDILLLIALIQVVSTVGRFWLEVRR